MFHFLGQELHVRTYVYLLEVARQQVGMSVVCKYVASFKYKDLCTSNKTVEAPVQRCNYLYTCKCTCIYAFVEVTK